MTTLKQKRISEFRAQDSGRTIVTTYYETPLKAHSMRVIRSLHAHTAVPNVVKHMQLGNYDARVAEVWDEVKNEILVSVVIPLSGKMDIIYFYDPITGEKLRPQPHEVRKISEVTFGERMTKIMETLSNNIAAGASMDVIDKTLDKITSLREIVK